MTKATTPDPVLVSLSWEKDKGFNLVENHLVEGSPGFEDKSFVASANFTNAINQTGWSYFEVKTNGHHTDRFQVCKIVTFCLLTLVQNCNIKIQEAIRGSAFCDKMKLIIF